jgi:hypothetical protein
MKTKQKLILVMIAILVQAACGTFDVSVQESTPTGYSGAGHRLRNSDEINITKSAFRA